MSAPTKAMLEAYALIRHLVPLDPSKGEVISPFVPDRFLDVIRKAHASVAKPADR